MWQGSRKRKSSFSVRSRTATRRTLKQKTPLKGKGTLRHNRLKKRLYLTVGVVAALVLAVVGLSALSFLDRLLVKEVEVRGQQSIHPVSLESRTLQYTASAIGGLFSRQNILLYPVEDVKKLLAFEFPRIEEIEVKRDFLKRTVALTVNERIPYVLWCRESFLAHEESEEKQRVEECYLADRTGFLFAAASGTETLIKLYGGVKHADGEMLRKTVTPSYFQDVVTLLTGLQELDLHIREVRFRGDEAEITVDPGWQLLVAFSKDITNVATNLITVLEENELIEQLHRVKYIDLRFDDRAYYKLVEE